MARARSIAWRLVPVLLPGVLWLALASASLGLLGFSALPGIAMSGLASAILIAAGIAALGARRRWVVWVASAPPAISLACAQAAVLVSHWLESRRPPRLINGHELSVSQATVTMGAIIALSLLAAGAIVAWEVLLVGIVWVLEQFGPRPGQCPQVPLRPHGNSAECEMPRVRDDPCDSLNAALLMAFGPRKFKARTRPIRASPVTRAKRRRQLLVLVVR